MGEHKYDYKSTLCPCGSPKVKKAKFCKSCRLSLDRSPEIFETLLIDGEPCRQLPLNHGLYAIVDADLYDDLIKKRWCATWHKHTKSYRVLHSFRVGDKTSSTFIHRYILGVGADTMVDHKNHNTLDERRSNLRECSSAENNRNRRPRSKSGFKGAYPVGNKWVATIQIAGKSLYLGSYGVPEEAAKAYDAAAIKYFGEFAWLNFPKVNIGGGV